MSDQHFESLLLGSNNDSATAKLPQIGGVVGHLFLCFIFYNFLLSVKVVPNNLKCLGCDQDFDASALDADVLNSLCSLCHVDTTAILMSLVNRKTDKGGESDEGNILYSL